MRWILAAIVSLAACDTPAPAWSTVAHAPDGGWMFIIRCRGDMGNCYAFASKICPGGYRSFSGDARFQAGRGVGTLLVAYDRAKCPGL